MSDQIVPVSRVFHIARECYVIYLGRERDDIRPFLRIGNMRDLPEEVIDAVSTTVITDDHIGNPLLEILYTPRVQGRYLGDTQVVGTMRRFFKSFDLPTDEVTDYRHFKDGEKRHMVWFYSSGNIHLRFDDEVIFDLDRKQREDRHFIRLFEEAKGEFLRNSLRYIRQDFRGPGVILASGNVFWYEAGELCALKAHPGFVARLMRGGIDPDFVSAYATDINPDNLDSSDSAVFVGYIKRTRQRRKQIKAITTEAVLLRKLKHLFPARGDIPAAIDVVDVSGTRKALFRDAIVRKEGEGWRVTRAGVDDTVVDAEGTDRFIQIDADNGTLSVNDPAGSTVFSPPEGFPLGYLGHGVEPQQALEKYIVYLIPLVRDHMAHSEVPIASALERYARQLLDDVRSDKAQVSPLHRQVVGALRDAFKKAKPATGSPSWFLYQNLVSFIDLLTARIGESHPVAKAAGTVKDAAITAIQKIGEPEAILPYWGDLYLEGTPRLFWRSVKRLITPADIASSREAAENIAEIARLDEGPWAEDRERLLKLIASLADGGVGSLTEEQMALLETEDEKEEKTEKEKSPPAEAVPAPKKISGDEAERGKPQAAGAASPGKERRGGSGKGWIAVAAVLVLLLLFGAAYIWDRSGKSPWTRFTSGGPVFASIGGDPGGSGDDVDSQDGTSDGSPGGGEDGTGDSDDQTGGVAGDATDADGSDATTGDTGDDGTAGADATDQGGPGVADGDVDPDVAPHTLEEIDKYLSVDDRVEISEIDIHLAANEIAVSNGYKDLDYRVFEGRDPDWIWPGNVLEMPDDTRYEVQTRDTIWFLAARLIRIDVQNELAVYDEAIRLLDDSNTDTNTKRRERERLAVIARESRSASMRRLAAQAAERYGE